MNHVQLARKAATLDHAGGTYWRRRGGPNDEVSA